MIKAELTCSEYTENIGYAGECYPFHDVYLYPTSHEELDYFITEDCYNNLYISSLLEIYYDQFGR